MFEDASGEYFCHSFRPLDIYKHSCPEIIQLLGLLSAFADLIADIPLDFGQYNALASQEALVVTKLLGVGFQEVAYGGLTEYVIEYVIIVLLSHSDHWLCLNWHLTIILSTPIK